LISRSYLVLRRLYTVIFVDDHFSRFEARCALERLRNLGEKVNRIEQSQGGTFSIQVDAYPSVVRNSDLELTELVDGVPSLKARLDADDLFVLHLVPYTIW
jgi:hypothetical protein